MNKEYCIDLLEELDISKKDKKEIKKYLELEERSYWGVGFCNSGKVNNIYIRKYAKIKDISFWFTKTEEKNKGSFYRVSFWLKYNDADGHDDYSIKIRNKFLAIEIYNKLLDYTE